MIIGGLNYLVVVLAGAAGWIAGAVWYGVLGKHWVAALGKTMDEFKGEQAALKGNPTAGLPFILAFVGNVVMAWVLAGLLSHYGPGQATVKNGLALAVSAWLGFVLT